MLFVHFAVVVFAIAGSLLMRRLASTATAAAAESTAKPYAHARPTTTSFVMPHTHCLHLICDLSFCAFNSCALPRSDVLHFICYFNVHRVVFMSSVTLALHQLIMRAARRA